MTEPGEIRTRIVDSISPERLMADTEELARWVRMSGSEEERAAFDHVESVLLGLGLRTERHASRAYISLPEGATLAVGGRDVPAITHSMAPSTPEGGLELPLVYVGAGAPEDNAGRDDVGGRIALVDGIAIPGKALAAERAGAAACVFANADEHVHEMIVSTVWGSPTPEDRDKLPKIPMASVGAAGARTLRDACESGTPTVHLTTRVSEGWREIPTLTAQLDGTEEPEKFVLFSGHIDSWHRGAMDNGSSNALMLEVLRALVPEKGSLRRSIRLAFWSGHSHGRYAGSAWYADNFWEDLEENCVLHLNTDSAGGRGATVLTEGQAMAETRGVAAEEIRSITGEEFRGSRFGRSGDQSFMSLGVPSLFMFVSEQPQGQDASAGDVVALLSGPGARGGGVGWWWHTTEDTPDKLDPAFLARDARIFAACAHRFLSDEILPLDVGASAAELAGHIDDWAQKARGRFDLSAAVARARQVADLAARLAGGIEGARPEDAARLNGTLMDAGRRLVRLDYAVADPFAQDPAIGQPPVPLLAPVDALLGTEPESDGESELLVLLVRRRNRVMHELARTARALRHGLGE